VFGVATFTWILIGMLSMNPWDWSPVRAPTHGQSTRARLERLSRLERWLCSGLHSLDFPFLYYSRPAWDVVVVALSLGGLLVSGTAVVLVPWKRNF